MIEINVGEERQVDSSTLHQNGNSMTEVITPAMPEQHVTGDALCPDDLLKALVKRGFYIFDRPSALQAAPPGRRCQLGHRGSTEPLPGQVQAMAIAGGSHEAA